MKIFKSLITSLIIAGLFIGTMNVGLAKCYTDKEIRAFKKSIKIEPTIIDKSGFYHGEKIIQPKIESYLISHETMNGKDCLTGSRFYVNLTPVFGKSATGDYKISVIPQNINLSLKSSKKTFRPKITLIGKTKNTFTNPVIFSEKNLVISVNKISITNNETVSISLTIANNTKDFVILNSMYFYTNGIPTKLPLYDLSLANERDLNVAYNQMNPNVPQMTILPNSMTEPKYIKIPPHTVSNKINVKVSMNASNLKQLGKIIELFSLPVTKASAKTMALKLAIAMEYTNNGKQSSFYSSRNAYLWKNL